MLSHELTRQLEHALRDLHYGSIQLIVHESQVVRIERVERIRLTADAEAQATAIGRPTPTMEVRRHDHGR